MIRIHVIYILILQLYLEKHMDYVVHNNFKSCREKNTNQTKNREMTNTYITSHHFPLVGGIHIYATPKLGSKQLLISYKQLSLYNQLPTWVLLSLK